MPIHNYNKPNDILYIGFSDNQNSIGCEEYNGLVVSRDLCSDEIAGVMLYDIMEKYNRKSIPKPPEGITLNFDKEVLPYIM